MNIFVGNLSFNSDEASIREAFSEFGEVVSAKVITDRETGRSRGFAFVEMSNDSEAKAAIAALDGADLDGRNIRVNESQPREPREPRQRRY